MADPVIDRALEHKKKVREKGFGRLDIDQSTFLEYLADSTDGMCTPYLHPCARLTMT